MRTTVFASLFAAISAVELGKESGCPTCPPTTTTCAPATTTAPPTTTTAPPTTTTAPPTLPTTGLFEVYNSRMKDTCTGKASLACHDGTVQQQGHQIGYMLTQPISGITEELFAAYSSRIKDTCTGKSSDSCHDGTVQQMGSSQGFVLKNPVPSKTAPLYMAYSSRMNDSCTGPSGSACHDGNVNSIGHLVGHMLTTQAITLQDIQASMTVAEENLAAAVDSDSGSFDYGTTNLVCEEWYGTLNGGGHTQSDCLSFCSKDFKCRYATFYAESGYCHISGGCDRRTTTSHDSPITYHKTSLAQTTSTMVV